jgi:hypothetical protein
LTRRTTESELEQLSEPVRVLLVAWLVRARGQKLVQHLA